MVWYATPPSDGPTPVSHSLNQLRTPHEVGGGLAIVSAGKEMDVSANTTDNLPQQQPTTGHTCHFQRNKQTNKQTNERTNLDLILSSRNWSSVTAAEGAATSVPAIHGAAAPAGRMGARNWITVMV